MVSSVCTGACMYVCNDMYVHVRGMILVQTCTDLYNTVLYWT